MHLAATVMIEPAVTAAASTRRSMAAPPVAHTLDELGTMPLLSFRYDPISGPGHKDRLTRDATAFPTWNQGTIDQSRELDWDGFWAVHPIGASRLTRLDVTTFEDAVKAAHAVVLTTRPGMADGDKQAQAVLQAADGAWYISALGGVVGDGAWLARLGTYPGFWSDEPTKGLVDQLLAEADMNKRLQTWQQVQTNFYQTVPAIKLGDQSGLNARSSRIGGWTEQIDLGTPFWNLWLKK